MEGGGRSFGHAGRVILQVSADWGMMDRRKRGGLHEMEVICSRQGFGLGEEDKSRSTGKL